MLGSLIERIRKEKGITKTQLANSTGVNIGHLTHIENGSRKPSHKTLKEITTSLGVPYQQLYYTYDKELDEKQLEYGYVNYINYNKVPAISQIDGYIDCPVNFPNAAFAYRIPDNAMSPILKEDFYVYVELNGLIDNKEIGLFRVNDQYFIRKLIYKRNGFLLKAIDSSFPDISISNSDDFQIIGKIYI